MSFVSFLLELKLTSNKNLENTIYNDIIECIHRDLDKNLGTLNTSHIDKIKIYSCNLHYGVSGAHNLLIPIFKEKGFNINIEEYDDPMCTTIKLTLI